MRTFFCTMGSSENPIGCGPHPTLITCPLGRTQSMACWSVWLIPAESITQSAPIPSSSFAHVPARSEEHTSELQSLMRISYAVFCLKKKKQHTKIQKNRQ